MKSDQALEFTKIWNRDVPGGPTFEVHLTRFKPSIFFQDVQTCKYITDTQVDR